MSSQDTETSNTKNVIGDAVLPFFRNDLETCDFDIGLGSEEGR